MRVAGVLIFFVVGCAFSSEEVPGCDQARWDSWVNILEETRPWPDDQAAAREAMEFNRTVCADLSAGRINVEEADRRQSDSIGRLWRALQGNKARRQEQQGLTGAG